MNTVYGNLLTLANQCNYDVVIHGCNCHCLMGGGIARQIKEIFPQAYQADLKTIKGDRSKLGNFSSAIIDDKFTIINAYTQYNISNVRVSVDYEAIKGVMKKVKQQFSGMRIAYPKIGAGLAGGNWNVISKIIDLELQGENHTLVCLP